MNLKNSVEGVARALQLSFLGLCVLVSIWNIKKIYGCLIRYILTLHIQSFFIKSMIVR